MRERTGRRSDRPGTRRGAAVALWAARLAGRGLGDERGQDVVEYGGLLLLVVALVAAVASLGLGTTLASAVRCSIQQIEQAGCGSASGVTIGTGSGSLPGVRPIAQPRPARARQYEQAVHRHSAKATAQVPTALRQLQRDAAFFRTSKGSLVAFALARQVASQACHANGGDMVGPDFLCSGSQYATNEVAVYRALQNGRSVTSLNLIEPSFNTNAGFLDPVTLLTSLAAGPAADLITSIAGTLAKDGIEQGGATAVAGLLGKHELATDASLLKTLVASGDLPPIAGGSQLEDLLASARQLDPADAGGQLTRAGRAYAKHSKLFPPVTGGPAAFNEAGQKAVEDILSNPATKEDVMRGGRFAGGELFIAPNGIGAVFDTNGVFQYFGRFPYS